MAHRYSSLRGGRPGTAMTAMVLALAAYAANAAPSGASPASPASPVARSATPATPATLTDQTGRTVAIPPRVDRIASLVIPGASMVVTLDQSATRLAGIHPVAREDLRNGLLERFFPALRDIPANLAGEGFAPNVEALLRTPPDVVLQWGDRGEAVVRPMERAGLNVLTLRYGRSDYVATWLRMLGTATHRGERGEALARWIEAERDAIAAAVRDVPASRRPRVLFLYRYHGGLMAAGSGTSFDFDIRLAGGINVAAGVQGNTAINREQVMAWAPDVILLGNMDARLLPDDLRRDAMLAATPAVRHNRLYKLPRGGFRWDPPSQETPLTWRWLAGLLHPDRFPRQDLRARVVETYRTLYGREVDHATIDAILRLDLNSATPGYDVYARKPA